MSHSKVEKINVLNMIRRGEEVPSTEEYNFILFDLLEDGMITNGGDDSTSMYLTYFGLKELEDWDPVLQVSINYQLLQTPYGEA